MQYAKLAKHIESLCFNNKITCMLDCNIRSGHANLLIRAIKIRPVKSYVTYTIALHEIGHILAPSRSYGTFTDYKIESEINAWGWAINNNLVWMPIMTKTLYRGLAGYVKYYPKFARDSRVQKLLTLLEG